MGASKSRDFFFMESDEGTCPGNRGFLIVRTCNSSPILRSHCDPIYRNVEWEYFFRGLTKLTRIRIDKGRFR